MDHTLINTIVFSLVFAFLGGVIARKLNLPTIFGYLVAGIAMGPYTPGFIGDLHIANQLAEIGIILLMFGVGLHFSPQDLLKVKGVAVPGALFQMVVAATIGASFAVFLGYNILTGFIFGACLSVASTIVLLRALEDRGDIKSDSGKIAVGWLIIEDIAMVLLLVMLPLIVELATSGNNVGIEDVIKEILTVALKVGGFFALMIIVGKRFLPSVLVSIAHLKSRELTTLGTLAIALGFAFIAYTAFGVSFALGAFLAGVVLNESDIGHKAAEQSLPMRDAFAVLFFVSVGMLFDPMTLIRDPLLVLATLAIIVVGKAVAALCITAMFKQSREISLTIAYSLAQIGEFSFILAGIALTSGLMPKELYNLVLAGALLSIALNPFLFKLLDRQLGAGEPSRH